MTRLDDAGVNRADRDLEHAFPFGNQVREFGGGLDRNPLRAVEGLAEWKDAPRPPVMDDERTGIGMTHGNDPEQAAHFALVPVRSRQHRRQRRHLWTGPSYGE